MTVLVKTGGVIMARVALGVVALCTDVVISRFLGPEVKGEYFGLVVVASLLSTLVTGGQDYALNEHAAPAERHVRNSLLSTALVAAFFTWIVVATFFAIDPVVRTAASALGSPLFLSLAPLAVLWAGVESVFVLAGMLLVTSGAPVRFAGLRVVRRILVLGGMIALVSSSGPGDSVVESMLLVQILAAATTAFLILKGVGYRFERPRGGRKMGRSGLSSLPARVAERLQNRVAVFVVAGLAGASQVGLFSVSLGLAELLFYLTGSLGTVLFSVRADDPERVFRPVRMISPVLAFAVLVFGAAGALLVPVVYGAEYSGAALPLVLLLPGVACLGIVQTLSPFLVQRGLQRTISRAQVVGLSVLVLLTVSLVPEFGAVGAAVGVSLGYATTFLHCLRAAAHEAGQSTLKLLIPRREDVLEVRSLVRKMAER